MNQDSITAIVAAARAGHTAVVSMLIDAEADVNLPAYSVRQSHSHWLLVHNKVCIYGQMYGYNASYLPLYSSLHISLSLINS